MSTTAKTLVSIADVRAWAIARGLAVGARGRLSQEVIEAFNSAHRVKEYRA